MDKKFLAALTNLIKTLNANTSFYRQATNEVNDHSLANKLKSLEILHEKFANMLQPYVISERGEQEQGHDLSIGWRKTYSHFLAQLKHKPRETYKEQMTNVESETLQVLDHALALSPQKVISDKLRNMRENLVAHYNAILTTQHRIVAEA